MDDFSRSLRVSLSAISPKDDVVPQPIVWLVSVEDFDAIDLSDFKESGVSIGIQSPEMLLNMLPKLYKLLEDAETVGVSVDMRLVLPPGDSQVDEE